MKQIVLLTVLAASLAVFAGCTVTMPYSAPGTDSQYLGSTGDYEIIGETHGRSTAELILTIPLDNDAGYEAAYKDALERSGADALIDVYSDIDYKYFFPPLYQSYTTTVYGTAIRYTGE